jgi:excisionase family DNA binding protein
MTSSTSAPELLTRRQAAQYLGLVPRTLAVWASTGRYKLPYVRVGRSVRYRREDLDQFLADRRVTHPD